ncbi:MAG: S-methyl-5-thioribose-1-phosphate isomerase [Gammaproteobacteria bacterium]|nr:S-methyl-5-thioribose-1-phosphate isomerase [Gammaproteobacteria bacterium]
MSTVDLHDTIRAVAWEGDRLKLLDQRILPAREKYLTYETAEDIAAAITDMVVRGAPAIGCTAAYGVVLAARAAYLRNRDDWKQLIQADMATLAASRPTAINLFWALQRMQRLIDSMEGEPVAPLLAEAQRIQAEDIAANHAMGELGASLMSGPAAVITHCNTGSLATGGYGTALGVIRTAYSKGLITEVFADETRPWLQGSRLTAWELVKDGIPVRLLADGAAAHRMKQGGVSWAIVGSDRITADGSAANKIGTYSLAVNARYHGVKFMVVAPTSTVDMEIADGREIPIEQRDPNELLSVQGTRFAAEGAGAWNPVFDVTPPELIDAIVTEKGIVLNPTREKMLAMMKNG